MTTSQRLTSKPLHVRLEVMVDSSDETLCGDDCPFVDVPQSPMRHCRCEAFGDELLPGQRRESLVRSIDCLTATASEFLRGAVVKEACSWVDANASDIGKQHRLGRAVWRLCSVDAMRAAERKGDFEE